MDPVNKSDTSADTQALMDEILSTLGQSPSKKPENEEVESAETPSDSGDTEETDFEEEEEDDSDYEEEAEEDEEEEPEEDTEEPAGKQGEKDLQAITAKYEEKIDALSEQIRQMQEQMAEKSTERVNGLDPSQDAPEEQNFITEEEAEELGYSDTTILNKILNKVYAAGLENGRQYLRAEAPKLLDEYEKDRETRLSATRDFWQKNGHLLAGTTGATQNARIKFVANIANEVGSEHPAWSIDQIKEETARRAEKRLRDLGVELGAPQAAKRKRSRKAKFGKAPGAGSPRPGGPKPKMNDIEDTLTFGKGFKK